MNSRAQDVLKECPSYYKKDATLLENAPINSECPVEKLQLMRLFFTLFLSETGNGGSEVMAELASV
jgi:hypothetical protein